MAFNRRQLITGNLSGLSPSNAMYPPRKLVVVFQRGAADGLNSVVPYGDADYTRHRPTIAVNPPDEENGALDLDGFFGFHPALAPLLPYYNTGDLAIVHATGIPHGSRSHFAAQGLVERGVDDKSGPTTGWLGRYLANNPSSNTSAFRAVSISGNVPVSFLGATDPVAISNLDEFGFDQEIIDSGYPDILNQLFRSTIPLNGAAQSALSAMDELRAADLASFTPQNGANYPSSALGNKMQQASKLLKAGLSDVVFLDSDGWDHHENLPQYIQNSLTDMAASLDAFATDLGSLDQVIVLVMSEFGRRVAQNGSSGADHGTAGCAYLLGGHINGGQVVGEWPGLHEDNLAMGEDLMITTDLRSVLIELLDTQLLADDAEAIFPGFSGPSSINITL